MGSCPDDAVDAHERMLRHPFNHRECAMTLCPIALAAGCKKCPAFSVCPLKTVLGDQPKADAKVPPAQPDKKP